MTQIMSAAMEMTTEELLTIVEGRKVFFNTFYDRVCSGMKGGGEAKFLRAVATYRDRNIEILSAPQITTYPIFGDRDWAVVFEATRIPQLEVDQAVIEYKKEVKEGCRLKGYTSPASLFENLTSFRVLLLLIMRYFMEAGKKAALDEACYYMGYSMYFTIYKNYWRKGMRQETMNYTMTQLTNKYILKSVGDVDHMLYHGVSKCVTSYKKRIMDCTDQDVNYVISQFKSRLNGHVKSVAREYFKADKTKDAIFESREQLTTEEGTDFVERGSRMSDVEQLAQQYTSRFFQKPIDDQIIALVSTGNGISRIELKNAITLLRSDRARIPQVKDFYAALFYLYMDLAGESAPNINSIHTKKFLAVMEVIYKKGNAKDKNVIAYKKMLDSWLTATSQTYREVSRLATLNNFRKALYQYFVYSVTLRQ